MKLSICLLLAVVAAASADQGFYQQQSVTQSSQSAPSGYVNENSYDYRPPARQGWLDKLFGSNRRQGIAGALGAIGPIGAVIGVALVVAVVVFVVVVGVQLNTSGRGLDNDEWEVDHSIWMDQLHKDFEDSWSQQ